MLAVRVAVTLVALAAAVAYLLRGQQVTAAFSAAVWLASGATLTT